MNLEVYAGTCGSTVVTLSERNLLELLGMLDTNNALMRFTDAGLLRVRAETDATHYRDRVPGMPVPKGHRRLEPASPPAAVDLDTPPRNARLLVDKDGDIWRPVQGGVLLDHVYGPYSGTIRRVSWDTVRRYGPFTIIPDDGR